ncbi:MAG: class I SAM-dependent methyltransferase [Candidatus Hydrogenedentes bacterium]|nr:class I SAM-dependent methyltransferase [Candidatus Hydrogenedentota bacterium]
MLKPQQDAFGQILWDHLEGRTAYEIVERDDGFVDVSCGPLRYFSAYAEWPEHERAAMEYAGARVLDVGCGAGRHALHLQEQGRGVLGIDISPKAIQVCKRRGVKRARVLSVTAVGRRLGAFDTVLMMCNNFGLVGGAKRAPWLLRRFAAICSPGARIIANSTDPAATENPCHLRYQRHNRARGRMPGQLRIRVRYQTQCTPWFDYLLASPREMERLAADTPWRVDRVLDAAQGGSYIAILVRR